MEANEKFSAELWLARLLAQTGVTALPQEVHQACMAKRSANGVNEAFFSWFTSRKDTSPHAFEPEDLKIFSSMVNAKNTAEYTSLKNTMGGNQAEAESLMRRSLEYLKRAAENRNRLMILEGRSQIDLTAEVQAIVADNWYKYESGLTKQSYVQDSEPSIIFSTPDVYMKHFHKEHGVNKYVHMGKFLVLLKQNRIQVMPHEGNTLVERYPHPHIAGDGEVCWGNAVSIYAQAIMTLSFGKAMSALRVILSTYNEESPFRAIEDFIEAGAKTQDLSGVEYTLVGTGWVREDYIRDLYEDFSYDEHSLDYEESDDGEDAHYYMCKLEVFKLSEQLFIKVASRYIPVKKSFISGFEET